MKRTLNAIKLTALAWIFLGIPCLTLWLGVKLFFFNCTMDLKDTFMIPLGLTIFYFVAQLTEPDTVSNDI